MTLAPINVKIDIILCRTLSWKKIHFPTFSILINDSSYFSSKRKNSILKYAKDLQRHFFKGKQTSIHMERCSTSFVIRRMRNPQDTTWQPLACAGKTETPGKPAEAPPHAHLQEIFRPQSPEVRGRGGGSEASPRRGCTAQSIPRWTSPRPERLWGGEVHKL